MIVGMPSGEQRLHMHRNDHYQTHYVHTLKANFFNVV